MAKTIVVRQIILDYQQADGPHVSANAIKVVTDSGTGEVDAIQELRPDSNAAAAKTLANNVFTQVKAFIEAQYPNWTVEAVTP